jgi:CheY-like chemotaxis protein
MTAGDAEEALRLARSGAPDVVLADRAIVLEPGTDFVGRLREDPLTDFVPVVLLLPPGSPLDPIAVREAGADEALSKPFDAETLLRTVALVTDTMAGPAGASTLTGNLTVEEIADRIADEVKRGLVEAAQKGKDISIPMGDGTPLLAAAWSAIGRVRAHVAERSGGRVRFREGPQRGGPAFVTMSGEDAEDADEPLEVDVAGRRVLVVDDDPAVVWFFSGLLREHGADAVEAENGLDALEKARRRRPDLIISDILMPKLDGFGLTRALKRDPVLSDVPVILISWKEDFLQRMRQLRSGASGYLRKEAGSGQILAAVRDALRQRARLESRLRAGGDVRGRLEDLGIQTLLTTLARFRPDARLVLRDAANLYEVEIRKGELVDVTRTASDGTFARGVRVVDGLLAVSNARYTIADGEGNVRRSIDVPLETLLDKGMVELAARVDCVSGRNLSKVEKIDLDEAVVSTVLRSSPEEVERVVASLRDGEGPRALLMGGDIEPRVLEEVLVDLARQGAIRRVLGADGEDRVALAREAREMGLHPELSEHPDDGTLSWLPTDQTTQEILLETQEMAKSEPPDPLDDDDLESDLESLRPPPTPAMGSGAPGRGSSAPGLGSSAPGLGSSAPGLAPGLGSSAPGLGSSAPGLGSSAPGSAPGLGSSARGLGSASVLRGAREPSGAFTREQRVSDLPFLDEPFEGEPGSEPPPSMGPAPSEEITLEIDAPDDEPELIAEHHDALPSGEYEYDEDDYDDEEEDEGAEDEEEREADEGGELETGEDEDEGDDEDEDEEAFGERLDDDTEPTPEPTEDPRAKAPLKLPPAPKLIDAREDLEAPRPLPTTPPSAGAPPAERGMGLLGWTLVVLVLGAVGFVGFRLLRPTDEPPVPGPIAPDGPTANPPLPEGVDVPEVAPDGPERPDEDPEPGTEADLPLPYGREEPGVTALPSVAGPAGQGLLVVEPAPGAAPMTVEIGDHRLQVGEQPVGLALAPGVHHLMVVRGDNRDFVWVAIRAGTTRFVPPMP